MPNKMLASVLGGVATIPLMTKSGTWTTTDTGAIQQSTTRTITVPKGNPGKIEFGLSADEGAGDTAEYSINGGSYVFFSDGTEISISSGQSLRFRVNVFDIVSVSVFDKITPTQKHLLGSFIANRTS